MSNIPQPKRSDLPVWVIWVMSTAVASMGGYLAFQDRIHRAEMAQKDTELQKCQEERTKAETAFRAEITVLYKEVQEFREEIYRQAAAQQRKIKRLR